MRTFLNTAAIAAMACGHCALAQEQAQESRDSRAKSEIEHVLVTVPIHRTEAKSALPVTVLTGDDLRNNVANTIGETLQSKPGLASASFGPAVGQPVIRGQQGARVTVLQNSTSSADASNISADHSVSVEPILAESIEVLRGPSTLLYGGGAIGGVVNVIDKRVPVTVPEELSGAMEVRHGSVNDEDTVVFTLDGGSGNVAFHLDGLSRTSNNVDIPGMAAVRGHEEQDDPDEEVGEVNHEEEESTDGYIANTDAETKAFTTGGSYFFDKGYIGLSINRLENEYGIPAGAHGHHEEHEDEAHEGEEHVEEESEEQVRLDIEQTRYDLRADIHDISSKIENLRWYLTYSDYEHDELEGEEVGTNWSIESSESRLELVHRELSGWHGVLGMQFKLTDFSAVGDESYIPQTDITSYGVFLVEDFHHGNWMFELGARINKDKLEPDSVSRDESFISTSMSASALWQMSKRWQLGVAMSQSERAPVVEELYSNDRNSSGDYIEHVASGAIEVGDPGLDGEQANNIDLTLNYKGGRFDGYLTVFYNDFKDYIFLANPGLEQEETPVLRYAQQDAEFVGVEFEFDMMLGSALGGDFTLAFFGDYIDGELDSAGDVPRLPPQRFGGKLSYESNSLSTYVSVMDAAEQDKPGLNEEETDGYTRWDAGINYRFAGSGDTEYLTFVRLKNIDDEEIRNASSFLRDIAPEAGRSIEAGVRLRF